MKIEHIGIMVPKPISAGNWYNKHLGLAVIRQLGSDEEGVTFLRDNETDTVIELAKLSEIPDFDFNELDPLHLHIAIECDDPAGLSSELEKAGASIIGESARAEAANERILVKDPWGITIQLIILIERID
jgi:catechol 2,3-dioxygenase-like lactoylglutathione lyase family enzyme